MTIEAEEETKVEEERNTEADTVTTTIVKGKKANAEDEGAPNSHENIATQMVAAHTAMLNYIPKELGTKTLPPLKTCSS